MVVLNYDKLATSMIRVNESSSIVAEMTDFQKICEAVNIVNENYLLTEAFKLKELWNKFVEKIKKFCAWIKEKVLGLIEKIKKLFNGKKYVLKNDVSFEVFPDEIANDVNNAVVPIQAVVNAQSVYIRNMNDSTSKALEDAIDKYNETDLVKKWANVSVNEFAGNKVTVELKAGADTAKIIQPIIKVEKWANALQNTLMKALSVSTSYASEVDFDEAKVISKSFNVISSFTMIFSAVYAAQVAACTKLIANLNNPDEIKY